ncbi:MAG: protein translocase subunit SecDF [Chitinophagales bacterium]|nr:protein translocase subunit SecDF [Chitinophagales bacterium]
MQAKGLIRAFIIALVVVCLYQLLFSFLAKRVESNAADTAQQRIEKQYKGMNLSQDSLKKLAIVEKSRFLDSVSNKPVYDLGFTQITYQDLLKYQINLGLDLQGGMSVVLQVSIEDLLKAMSNDSKDPNFIYALNEARKLQQSSDEDYITLFARAFQQKAGNKNSMSAIFATIGNEKNIKFGDPDDKVIEELRRSAEAAVDQTYNIVRARIDGLGVSNPNISKQPTTDRIIIELPGIDNPERARKLLQSTAKLEFWDTYDNQEIYPYLVEANNVIAEKLGYIEDSTKEDTTSIAADSSIEDSSIATLGTDSSNNPLASNDTGNILSKPAAKDTTKKNDDDKKFPLIGGANSLLSPNIMANQAGQYSLGEGPVVAIAFKNNRDKVNKYLEDPEVKAVLPRDLKLFWSAKANEGSYQLYAIKTGNDEDKAPLTGEVIEDATSDLGESGGFEVSIVMNEEGAEIWQNLTRKNSQPDNKRGIAITLDNQVLTAPVPKNEIPGGRSVITGNFTAAEAKDLASIIKAGKLPAPADIIEEEVVGPTLGKESINKGITSLVVGFLCVIGFMAFYYSSSSFVAILSLLLNMLFVAGALASFQAALTLPGMAGVLLTIAMAVDANVVIYERIREELEKGKGIKIAVADGYSKSYSAIIDANLTAIITGFILLFFGLGPVKGFAVIFVIGIMSSMITAVLFSRLLMDSWIQNDRVIKFGTKLTSGAFKHINIDFLGRKKMTYIISGLIIVGGLTSMFTKGFELGVDFTGGRTYDIKFDQPANTAQITSKLADQFEGKAPVVKTFGGANQVRITTSYKIDEQGKQVDSLVELKLYEGLKDMYSPVPSFDEFHKTRKLQSSKVGAAIADDILKTSVYAGVLAILFIFFWIFIRFRKYQYGVGAVVATLHDAFVMLSVFSILAGLMPFSLEIDQHFIAAILTIIGYSINDTVIVFDRIREYFREHPTKDAKTIANMAINDTLSRTIMTSFITFMVVTILFIFGGEMIRGFAFALMIGIIVGTYSSIFIASPVVIDLAKDDKDLR